MPAEERRRTRAGTGTPNPAVMDDVDYELLLGRLLSNSKSRQFLADLEVRIRRGDTGGASGFLLEALETGTIAALIMDRVESPGLLAFLQTLDKPQPGAGASAGAPPAAGSNDDTRLKELERVLESETNRANAAQRELDALRANLAAREANDASRSAELQDIVQRTKERVATATRDRDELMEQLAAARADGAERAALQRELQQERERAAQPPGTAMRCGNNLPPFATAPGKRRNSQRRPRGRRHGPRPPARRSKPNAAPSLRTR